MLIDETRFHSKTADSISKISSAIGLCFIFMTILATIYGCLVYRQYSYNILSLLYAQQFFGIVIVVLVICLLSQIYASKQENEHRWNETLRLLNLYHAEALLSNAYRANTHMREFWGKPVGHHGSIYWIFAVPDFQARQLEAFLTVMRFTIKSITSDNPGPRRYCFIEITGILTDVSLMNAMKEQGYRVVGNTYSPDKFFLGKDHDGYHNFRFYRDESNEWIRTQASDSVKK